MRGNGIGGETDLRKTCARSPDSHAGKCISRLLKRKREKAITINTTSQSSFRLLELGRKRQGQPSGSPEKSDCRERIHGKRNE